MPHVDEGLLHAWLDGAFTPDSTEVADIEAHLAGCADCRGRLEEARALKERADVVLRHAAPADVRVPPFEEVRARRQGAGAGLARSRRPWLPPARLAWAASVVLALGAGWMANELARGGQAPRFEALSDAVQASAPAGEADQAESDAPAGAPAPPNAQAAERAATGIARDAITETESLRSADATADESRGAGVRRPSAPTPPAVQGRPGDAAGALGARIQLNQEAAAKTVTAVRADSMRAGYAPAAAANVLGRAAEGTVLLSAAELIAADARASVDAPTLDDATRLLNDWFAASARGAWTAEPPGVAADRLGEPLATIQGVEQRSTELADVDGRAIARTLYRLQDGVVLELVQHSARVRRERALAEAAAADAVEARVAIPLTGLDQRSPRLAGLAGVLVRRPHHVLLLTGPIAPDSLAALAGRIR